MKLLIMTGMVIGLPLLGVWVAGLPLARYLEFPPRSIYVTHAPFSWLMFLLTMAFVGAVVVPFLLRIRCLRSAGPSFILHPSSFIPASSPFPWWGRFGLWLCAALWIFAWNRFPGFERLQPHTFSPLWFSYILVINAITWRRTGRCLMLDHPGRFAALFALSAGFWWLYEYLNRFVQNWRYIGADEFSAGEYFCYATLSYSTVLPAVLSTRQLLATWQSLSRPFSNWVSLDVQRSKRLVIPLLIAAGAGLVAIGVWPEHLYPLVWVSPLLIILLLQTLSGEPSLLTDLARGDWRMVVTAALAALVCGFFWEMWNYRSQAKWIYTIPYTGRFHLFEMPILGYAGYLPFGLTCVAVADLLAPGKEAGRGV